MIDPLWLLLIGIVTVIGSILLLRLHPFLALVMGALVVGSLTSTQALERYAQEKQMTTQETVIFTGQSVGERIANGFGRTCMKIGILVAMASIIGKCLLDSGAAERVIRSALRLFGEKNASLAFLNSGFLLGIPVYFDTVFYLMIPLAKAMAMRTKKNYGLYFLSIVAGGTMAHSLVPPTPGPLFVASELGVNIGTMILGGLVIGFFTATAGYLYALWANKRWPIPVRDTVDTKITDLEALSNKKDTDLPPLFISILPILLPVLLIAGKTVFISLFQIQAAGESPSGLTQLLNNIGNPNIALTFSAAIALATLAWKKRSDPDYLKPSVQSALSNGGLIILITSAGGAFGGILQQTGIGGRIQELATVYNLAILPLAFFVTALVRTAQGSATVSMITAVGILGGLANPEQLGFHPLYIALAVGCGSKPISWMNDSGFWIVCKMTGMTEAETFKNFSMLMLTMGIVGLIAVMIFARIFPMV